MNASSSSTPFSSLPFPIYTGTPFEDWERHEKKLQAWLRVTGIPTHSQEAADLLYLSLDGPAAIFFASALPTVQKNFQEGKSYLKLHYHSTHYQSLLKLSALNSLEWRSFKQTSKRLEMVKDLVCDVEHLFPFANVQDDATKKRLFSRCFREFPDARARFELCATYDEMVYSALLWEGELVKLGSIRTAIHESRKNAGLEADRSASFRSLDEEASPEEFDAQSGTAESDGKSPATFGKDSELTELPIQSPLYSPIPPKRTSSLNWSNGTVERKMNFHRTGANSPGSRTVTTPTNATLSNLPASSLPSSSNLDRGLTSLSPPRGKFPQAQFNVNTPPAPVHQLRSPPLKKPFRVHNQHVDMAASCSYPITTLVSRHSRPLSVSTFGEIATSGRPTYEPDRRRPMSDSHSVAVTTSSIRFADERAFSPRQLTQSYSEHPSSIASTPSTAKTVTVPATSSSATFHLPTQAWLHTSVAGSIRSNLKTVSSSTTSSSSTTAKQANGNKLKKRTSIKSTDSRSSQSHQHNQKSGRAGHRHSISSSVTGSISRLFGVNREKKREDNHYNKSSCVISNPQPWTSRKDENNIHNSSVASEGLTVEPALDQRLRQPLSPKREQRQECLIQLQQPPKQQQERMPTDDPKATPFTKPLLSNHAGLFHRPSPSFSSYRVNTAGTGRVPPPTSLEIDSIGAPIWWKNRLATSDKFRQGV